jgi:MoxR-like ATPase
MINIINQIRTEIAKVVVGQEKMIDGLLIGLLCDGHVLIEGIPGLAKTTTVKALSTALGLGFKRVQFTPDLLPSDILGAEVYDPQNNGFKIKKGPIFTNLLLADEINRAPAKVQSALLEAMAERQVTIGDESFELFAPFLVMATQNPIENEGVYPLPEAQLDRFMLKINVGYNTPAEELSIARRIGSKTNEEINAIVDIDALMSLKKAVGEVHIDEELEHYMIRLVEATRNPSAFGLGGIAPFIQFGGSPRVSIDMFKAVRAVAFLKERDFVNPSDVASIIKELMRHRLVLTYEAQAQEIQVDDLIETIIKAVPIP